MRKKIYYKIIHGFAPEDYVEIDHSELQKALYCFLEKKDGIFSGGAIRGTQILEIKPDFHRTMGWNRGYKIGAEDYEELAHTGIDRHAQLFLSRSKDIVQNLIITNQTHLIGKVPSFDEKIIEAPRGGGMKSIGKINNENK